MPWYRAIHSTTAIRDQFEEIWLANGSPPNVKLFGIYNPLHMQYEYYFNPESVQFAPDFVCKVALPCDTPDIQEHGLIPLVGNHYKATGND